MRHTKVYLLSLILSSQSVYHTSAGAQGVSIPLCQGHKQLRGTLQPSTRAGASRGCPARARHTARDTARTWGASSAWQWSLKDVKDNKRLGLSNPLHSVDFVRDGLAEGVVRGHHHFGDEVIRP